MRRYVWVVLAMVACDAGPGGPPATFVRVDQTQRGRVTDTIVIAVRVLDREDGILVGLEVDGAPDRGTLVARTVTTDLEGIARFQWVLDTVATLHHLHLGQEGGPALDQVAIDVDPDTAVTAFFTQDQIVVNGNVEITMPVEARDRYGNAVVDVLVVPVDVTTVVDSLRWIPNVAGRVTFRLPLNAADTLDAYVHTPVGSYAAALHEGDTLWLETGDFVVDTVPAATLCPVPDDTVATRTYAAVNVRQIRYVPGEAPDTTETPRRSGAMLQVLRHTADFFENRSVWFRMLGRPAPAGCSGTVYIRPWRFARFPALADSLRIYP